MMNNDRDFLYDANNFYRTRDYIVKQVIGVRLSDELNNVVFSFDTYYRRTKNVLYANGHTKSKLELKQSNQCKSKSRDSLRNLDFLSTYLER